MHDWMLQFRLSLVCGFVKKIYAVIAEYLAGQDRAGLEYSRISVYVQDLVTFCSSAIRETVGFGVPLLSYLNA